MALKLCNGSYISITAADVAVVFGLPNGPVPIVEHEGQQVPPELRAWREKIKHRRGKITVKALVTQMLEIKDGGEWFRRHFSVIVVSTLIACVSNGYANQRTLHMFRDVNRITDLGWCEYLLRSLVTAHGPWTQDRSRKFTGPLLFLTLLYVDRLVVGGRDVPRSVPTLNGWTSELLKARRHARLLHKGSATAYWMLPIIQLTSMTLCLKHHLVAIGSQTAPTPSPWSRCLLLPHPWGLHSSSNQ